MMQRRFLLASLALCALPARADTHYPTKPVTFVVQQSPGSTGDLVARALGDALSRRWGSGVVVENKPGANGMLASSQVARARPDGYTLLVSGSTPLAFNPHLYPNMPYDLRKDFSYVAPIQDAPFVLLASPKSGLRSYAQFLAAARAQPDQLTFASGGMGNSTHLVMEALLGTSQSRLRHIPFNGVGPAMLSTMTGDTDLMVSVLPSALTQVAAGKVVALAVSGSQRVEQLPDVPSFGELDIRIPPTPGSLVLVGPAGMPAALVDRINADVRAVQQEPFLQARFRDFQTRMFSGPPAAGAERFLREYREWGAFIKERGIQVN